MPSIGPAIRSWLRLRWRAMLRIVRRGLCLLKPFLLLADGVHVDVGLVAGHDGKSVGLK